MFFLLYINDLPDDPMYNIAIHADYPSLYSRRSSEVASKFESNLQDSQPPRKMEL